MSTDHEIDSKLARLGSRIQARRDQARQQFENAPELHDLREIKARFAGKVEYVATPGWTWGTDVRGTPCYPYRRPNQTRKGSIARLRKDEGREPT